MHETGHTIVAWYSPGVTAVDLVFVSPPDTAPDDRGLRTGGAVDLTMSDRLPWSVAAWDAIATTLGGAAATFNANDDRWIIECTDDLRLTTRLAERLLEEASPENCPWPDEPQAPQLDFAAVLAAPTSPEVCKVLQSCFSRAWTLIADNRAAFTRVESALRKEKMLSNEGLKKLLGTRPWAR